MSVGWMMIGAGILLCLAALEATIVLIVTAGSSKKRIMEKMEKKY